MSIVFDRDQVDFWVSQYAENTIRKLLTISPKQASRIKSGDYSGFERLLMWAATAQDQTVLAELELIEEVAGVKPSQAPVLLGMSEKMYRRARGGDPIPYHLAVYVRLLAGNKRQLSALINRTL